MAPRRPKILAQNVIKWRKVICVPQSNGLTFESDNFEAPPQTQNFTQRLKSKRDMDQARASQFN